MKFNFTSQPFETQYPKLVRDNIPQIIKDKDDVVVPTQILTDDQEYIKYLFKKVIEEAHELEFSQEHGNTIEELADIYELLETVLEIKNISHEQLESVKKEKLEKNGSFKKRILMLKQHNK